MITGISDRAGSAFNSVKTAHPSMPGINTSRVITAGCSSLASRIPSSPLLAAIIFSPSLLRNRCTRSCTVGSSSITSTAGAPSDSCAVVEAVSSERGNDRTSGSATMAGSLTVNVEPWPGILSTVISPPIRWQNFWLIARPNPVPPYFRVVEVSAWVKA